MASWFSSAALPLSLGETLNGLKDKVQAKVNSIDPDLIKKLTLQSDELLAERQQIDDEERRKEAVRDSLSEILPWDTRDAEMEILVDECREVILGLSSKHETFTGPFVLEGGLSVTGKGEEGGDDEDDDDGKMAKDVAAAEVSAEKLSKLQPLPALLASFDLDTHVGLIQRLLTVDPKLVDMQSRLSSGGERELIFWKNYFFHCAYTRYEVSKVLNSTLVLGPLGSTHRTLTLLDNRPVSASMKFGQMNPGPLAPRWQRQRQRQWRRSRGGSIF